MSTENQIQEALANVIDPNTGQSLVAARAVKNLRVEGGDVSLDVQLGYPAQSQHAELRRNVIAVLRAVPGVANV